MKKHLSFILATVMVFSLSACVGQSQTDDGGQSKTDGSNAQPKVSYDRNDPESILNAMALEFESAAQSVTDDSVDVSKKIGDSYNSYDKNKTAVADFYDNSLEKSEALYDTVETISVDYFKCVAGQGLDDYEVWDDSMEDFYDAWDDGMDDFYKAWDRAYDDVYDKCDELIGDASDTLEYAEYSDVWSEMYSTYSDAWAAMYGAHSDAWSNIYQDYSSTWAGFYNGNRDVDAILKDAAQSNNNEQSSDPKIDNNEGQPSDPKIDNNEGQPSDPKIDNNEGQPSKDAKPVDGTEHESGNFTYLIYSDGTVEITGYKGTDSFVTISSEIDGYDVSRIGDSAFEDCTSMESIVILPDLIRIGPAAFKGCTSLGFISVSSTVTEIEDSVFEGCSGLESVVMLGDITSLGDSAFKGCSSLKSITISSSTKTIGTSAFEDCTALGSAVFLGGEVIGDRAFKNCTSLSSVSIPSETTTIGASAFEGCTSLEYVMIWNDDIGIGANAFTNCPKLKDAPSSTMGEAFPAAPDGGDEPTTGIRPEFKEAMDSYEAFYDEYCAFMEQYSANPTDIALLGKYTDMLTRLSEMEETFEAWESEDLNDAELKYYLEVNNRVTSKLLDVVS